VARPGWRVGLVLVSAFALALAGACGGSSVVPPSDGGRDGKPAAHDGGHDAPEHADGPSHEDAARRDDATADAAKEAEPKDGPAADAGIDSGLPAGCDTGSQGQATELRCTGLYADWATKTVAANVRPYDPGLHLWSDGASKTRWIYLPPGTKIDTSNMDEWTFPPGTKIWKEFALGGTRMETRLLWKRPIGAGSWYFTTYRWSDDGETSTSELTTGQLFGADAGAASGYEIPAQTNCYDCHGGRFDAALGFEAVALSSPGASGVTMATLTAGDLLTDPPAAPIVIPGDAATAAALGYLHMNCGTSCHNRGTGEAGTTAFYMRLDVATLTSPQTTDTWTTGLNQRSYFTLPGVAQPLLFAPCDLDDNAAYYRLSHRDGVAGTPAGTQMPPIISHKVDTDGMAQVAAWLQGFPQCGAADAGRD
jgi:hypothetical protein